MRTTLVYGVVTAVVGALLVGARIVVATDLGVVVSSNGGTTWSRFGGNLPYTTTLDVHLGPDDRIYAATHGRGIWSIPKP